MIPKDNSKNGNSIIERAKQNEQKRRLFDSCIYPLSLFDQNFEVLLEQGPQNWDLKILLDILYCAKQEHIKVNKQQFDYLLFIAQYSHRKILKTSLNIIEVYSSYKEKGWFISIVPPNFIEIITALLNRRSAFNILSKCAEIEPAVTSQKLFEFGIINNIINCLKIKQCVKEALDLFSVLLRFEANRQVYEKYIHEIYNISFSLMSFDLFYSLLFIFQVDHKYIIPFISHPLYVSLFQSAQRSSHFRHNLIIFIVDILTCDNSLSFQIATNVQTWSFFVESFEVLKNIKDPKELRKKRLVVESAFDFFFLVGASQEGKLLLFHNGVHAVMLQLANSSLFKHVNRAMEVICQIGKSDSIEVVTALIAGGLIEAFNITLSALPVNTQRHAIDCLANIERVGELSGNMEIVGAVFGNPELVEGLYALHNSGDSYVEDAARSLMIRMKSFEQFNE